METKGFEIIESNELPPRTYGFPYKILEDFSSSGFRIGLVSLDKPNNSLIVGIKGCISRYEKFSHIRAFSREKKTYLVNSKINPE